MSLDRYKIIHLTYIIKNCSYICKTEVLFWETYTKVYHNYTIIPRQLHNILTLLATVWREIFGRKNFWKVSYELNFGNKFSESIKVLKFYTSADNRVYYVR